MLPQGSTPGEYNPSYVIKTEYLGDFNRTDCDKTRKHRGRAAAASLDHPSGRTIVLLLVRESASSGGALLVLPALS